MTSKFDILVAGSFGPAALERLERVGQVRLADRCDEAALIYQIAEADALLVRTYAQVTRRVIEAANHLKVIGRGGVGLENIDVEAARARGVTVVYTPAAASDAVAEFTIGLILALERHLARADAVVRQQQFAAGRKTLVGRELHGLTLGIVGLGRIGSRVGRIAQRGLGMTVLYNDIVEMGPLDYPATSAGKEQLWSQADVISLHVPLTELTHYLISAGVLAQFRPSATLINTSRGAVVDQRDLTVALAQGQLAGAALDVFESEPPAPDDPLLYLPNVLLTPHVAARTQRGLALMDDVVDDVIAVLEGQPPRYPA